MCHGVVHLRDQFPYAAAYGTTEMRALCDIACCQTPSGEADQIFEQHGLAIVLRDQPCDLECGRDGSCDMLQLRCFI
jgi:hypothetical protein